MGPLNNKLPQNAFRYYAQMYHKRRHTLESRYCQPMVDVYKSWNSLSESERQQFYNQYNEYKLKYNQLLADRLKEAEPFMKKKEAPNRQINRSSTKSVIVTDKQSDVLVEAVESQIENARTTSPLINQQGSECSDQFICVNDKSPDNENQTETDNIQVAQLNNTEQGTTAGEDYQTEHISEPAPLTVKNGKELYCMLDEGKCTPWASLPQNVKKQYSRAVYLLKKDYITKYKKYLESLTSKELFDYYNKKIF